MRLLAIPNELILSIAEYLGAKDLNSFLQANRYLVSLLTPLLYKLAAGNDELRDAAISSGMVYDNESLVRQMIEKESRIDYSSRWATILAWAAIWDHESVFKLLLDKGVHVNGNFCYRSRNWGQPLYQAVRSRRIKAAKLLLENGADLEPKSPFLHDTPLQLAARTGDDNMVRFLLEKGAKVNAESYRGTALRLAVQYLHTTTAEILLDAGADIHWSELRSWKSILHFAVELVAVPGDREKTIRMLLKRGARISAKCWTGFTPAEHYVDTHYTRVGAEVTLDDPVYSLLLGL